MCQSYSNKIIKTAFLPERLQIKAYYLRESPSKNKEKEAVIRGIKSVGEFFFKSFFPKIYHFTEWGQQVD